MSRRLTLIVLGIGVGAACTSKPGDYPYGGGGGGGGGIGSGQHDAAVHDGLAGDAAATIERVCVAADPRQLASCATTGAGGLTVTLGARQATTASDGTFALDPPSGVVTWHVTGAAIVPSVMPFVASRIIPALATTTFADLAASNGVLLSAGQGSVFVQVIHAGAPLAGAVATATPVPQYAPYYDGSTATAWNQNATGAHGVIWLAGVPVGTTNVAVTPAGGTAHAIPGIPVEDGAITYVALEIP